MTTEPLPFDGGATPEPPDVPRVGDRVYVKDNPNGVGEIYRIKKALGIAAAIIVVWRDADDVIIDSTITHQELLEFVSHE